MARKMRQRRRNIRRSGTLLGAAVNLFFMSGFLLLAIKDMAWQGFALAAAVPAMIFITVQGLPKLFPTDRILMSLTSFLCALGVLVLYATNPDYAYTQTAYYFVGLIGMIICIYLVRLIRHFGVVAAVLIPLSLGALAWPLLMGKEVNGATNWIFIGGFSLQPSELVKVALMLILAYFMSRRRMIPWLVFAAGTLGLLMLQKDLGTALLYYMTTLLLYFVASGNVILTGVGFLGAGGAAVLGYQMFAHVKKRVAVWRNPWADYQNAGYQIVQGLVALASGGAFGVGLGLGSPRTIPVYHTDYIFAVICEQFGLMVGLGVLLMYVAFVWRGYAIAKDARTSFHVLLAMGCTTLLALQTLLIIGGVLNLIPLTGVTLPFVSYGGSSLVSSMCLMGLLQGVSSVNKDDLAKDSRIAQWNEQEVLL